MFMPLVDEEPFRDHRVEPARPTTCTQRLEFMPPDAGDHQAQPAGTIFSPNTLKETVQAGFTAPPQSPEMKNKKKHRKRKGFSNSASQPAPKIRGLEDTIPPRADGFPRVHEAGKPILSGELLRLAEGPMIALQQSILHLEELLLRDKQPNYSAFAVQVPKELVDFVQEDPADIFFIAYEDVFKL